MHEYVHSFFVYIPANSLAAMGNGQKQHVPMAFCSEHQITG
jgi:hypothetical protein